MSLSVVHLNLISVRIVAYVPPIDMASAAHGDGLYGGHIKGFVPDALHTTWQVDVFQVAAFVERVRPDFFQPLLKVNVLEIFTMVERQPTDRLYAGEYGIFRYRLPGRIADQCAVCPHQHSVLRIKGGVLWGDIHRFEVWTIINNIIVKIKQTN